MYYRIRERCRKLFGNKHCEIMKKTIITSLLCVLSVFLYGQTLTPFQSDSLWGYVDSTGQFAIQPKYKQVCEFNHGVAAVVYNQSIGLIDTNGKVLQNYVYSQCPLLFGEGAFQPNYRGERKYIGWLMHRPASGVGLGCVWINQQGKILITGAKVVYTLVDRVPEALWDY